jgi:hypothetical protein
VMRLHCRVVLNARLTPPMPNPTTANAAWGTSQRTMATGLSYVLIVSRRSVI